MSTRNRTNLCGEKKPDLKRVIIFGCPGFAQTRSERIRKLDSRAEPCIFLGFDNMSRTYLVMWTKTGRFGRTRTARFDESSFIRKVEKNREQQFENRNMIRNIQKIPERNKENRITMTRHIAEIPKHFHDIENFPEKSSWYQAYYEEIKSLEDVGKLKVVERPTNQEVLPVLELFTRKFDNVTHKHKFKARIVVRGDLERSKVDENTYSPVANTMQSDCS